MLVEWEGRDKFFYRGVQITVGILVGIIVALMIITESSSLNQFYNGGKVYDVSNVYLKSAGNMGMNYDSTAGKIKVTEAGAYKSVALSGSKQVWNYIVLQLSGMNQEVIDGIIVCYNEKNEPVYERDVCLTEGKNIIGTEGVAYSSIQIGINNQTGAEFSIDKLQFREKLVDFSWGRFGVIWSISFLAYLAVIYIIRKIQIHFGRKKADWYGIIEWLQGLYMIAGEALGARISRISCKFRSRMRIVLFAVLILYMQIVMNKVIYENIRWYKVHMSVCCLVLFVIGILCYEKKLVRINWRNKLVWAWTILWVMVCVSDFFVGKFYCFSGYIMLLVVGFFYFMWHNMKDKNCIFHDFIMAVRVSFWLTGIFCFLCRPLVEGQRYMGSYINPGMYAMYVLFVWIAIWGDIDYKINRKEKLLPKLLPELAEVSLAGFLIWQTQSSSGIIPAIFVLSVFVFKQLMIVKSKKIRKRSILVMGLAIMMAVMISPLAKWGLVHIPELLDTQVKFEWDVYAENADMIFPTMRVYAAGEELKENRVIQKVFFSDSLEQFTTGRNLYWIAHLRETNLLGHRFQEVLWGMRRWPHNGFIAIIYRYGLFSIIPYVIMVFSNFAYAFRRMFQWKKNYGFYLFSVMAASVILLLMENLELPFLFLCWISMYMMMGINFVQEESKTS